MQSVSASNLSSITCATFNPDDLDDPRELDNTDLAIVEGHFGVAENGAVWITRQVKHKALYFYLQQPGYADRPQFDREQYA